MRMARPIAVLSACTLASVLLSTAAAHALSNPPPQDSSHCGATPADYLDNNRPQTFTGNYSHGGEAASTLTLTVEPGLLTYTAIEGDTHPLNEAYGHLLLTNTGSSPVFTFDTDDGVAVATPRCKPGTTAVTALDGYVGRDHMNTFQLKPQATPTNS